MKNSENKIWVWVLGVGMTPIPKTQTQIFLGVNVWCYYIEGYRYILIKIWFIYFSLYCINSFLAKQVLIWNP